MDIIEKVTVHFLLSNDGNKIFFSALLSQMVKQESHLVPTMGVTIQDGLIYLLYNKKFVESLYSQNKSFLVPIIEHELLHVVLQHIIRAKPMKELWNIATDLAVNSLIENIDFEYEYEGKKCKPLLPKDFGLSSKKTADWYYNQLLKNAKKINIRVHTLDDHSKWKPSQQHIYSEVIRQAVQKAYEQSVKLKGNISGYLEDIIKEIIKPPTISWRELLRQYVAASIKSGHKSSWKRANRRFPHLECIKGKVSDRTIKILVAFDTSGSISTDDFKDFLAEVKGLLNVYKCIIDYVECDTEIKAKGQIYPWSNLKINFKGRGGTDYKPVFKYFNKYDYDLLIYFTDLYCDYEGCKTNKDVIWVVTKEHDRSNLPPFGKVVEIK